MNKLWTITVGPIEREEEENEYNISGVWLGNTEINQVFILPEDVAQVVELLTGYLIRTQSI